MRRGKRSATITIRAGEGEDARDVMKALAKPKNDKAARLLAHVETFIKTQEISCGEAVYQCDSVIENAYEFITGCCEIVGYCREEG